MLLSQVGPARCAVRITLSSLSSGLSGGVGSSSNTSRPAPNSLFVDSASVIAFSSITGPREVFTMIADFFIAASSCAPIMWRVESFSGTCSERMSEWRRISGSSRKRTPSASSCSSLRRAMS